MKLAHRMTFGLLAMLIVAFSGTLFISLHNAENYFEGQLKRNADETAAILGASLSSAPNENKSLTLSRDLQNVVNKGEASRIIVKNAQGTVLADVKAPAKANPIPSIFAWIMRLPTPVGHASLGEGQNAGTVEVYAETHSTLWSLWTHALQLIAWNLVSVLLGLGLVILFVRSLLKPLRRVTAQAHALLNDEYTIQGTLPKTREFRELTLAMNQMVRRLRNVFQEQSRRVELLRQQAFQDMLTGLGNRRFFLHQLTTALADDDEFTPGFLVFVAIDGLSELNEKDGYVQGDKALLEVPPALAEFAETIPVMCMARVGGSQFGLLVQEQDAARLTQACVQLQQSIAGRLAPIGQCEPYIGAAAWRFLQPVESLLRESDVALTKAREQVQGVHVAAGNAEAPGEDALNASLSTGKMVLYWQKITDGQRVLNRRVFARLIGRHGEEINAASLLPLAEQAEIAWKIDFLVLDSLSGADPALLEPLSLGISANTVVNVLYRQQYLDKIAELPAPMRRLIRIEFPESLVLKCFEVVRGMMLELRKQGIGIGIESAGIHFGSMEYLEDLPILYVKLHGSLARDLVENESKQIFIHHFVAMAKTLEIQVIATQVEEAEQWTVLKSAGIVWGQGRHLAGLEAIAMQTASEAQMVD